MIGCMLSPGVEVTSITDDRVSLAHRARSHTLSGTWGLRPVLEKLRDCGPIDLDELMAMTCAIADDQEDRSRERLAKTLSMLAARRLTQFCVAAGGRLLCIAATTGQLGCIEFPAASSLGDLHDPSDERAGELYQVSRLACARREGSDLVIECPHLSVRVTVLAPEAAAALSALARPASLWSLTADLSFIEQGAQRDLLRFLIGSGVVAAVDGQGRLPEDRDPALAVREFHDVLMHAHSRLGYTDAAMGGTFRFAGVLPPWSAVSERQYAESVDLPKPDPADFARKDPPLGEVMEARQSVRVYGETPLTIEQLAEFLFRIGRIRSVRRPEFTGNACAYEITNRTYPSGGGAYDLEIYPVVDSCRGLQPGVYHYEPMRHRLESVSRSQTLVDRLIAGARLSARISSGPQVLLVLTSRFARLSWKYEGIAYATTLRNVGVLYEAMYLVATAMDLAPCALGSGNSALFAAALGLDSMAESPVGDFMLGSLPVDRDEFEYWSV